MKQLKENKIYTENFLIRQYIKEFRNIRNTDETINFYNTTEFCNFLEEKGFIYDEKNLFNREVYIYNPYLCKKIKDYEKTIKELKHEINKLKDKLEK